MKRTFFISACSIMFLIGIVVFVPSGVTHAEKELIREGILPVEKVEMNEIGILVNGQWLEMDTPAFMEKNRTMVPVRALMESLGAEVKWHPDRNLVEVYTNDTVIELVIGKNTAQLRENDKTKTFELDAPAKIVNERTFVPGRFVAEALGAKVEWNAYLRAMVIFTELDNSEIAAVSNLVEQFGQKLQMASLLAPEEVVKKSIIENYGYYVTESLLEKWVNGEEQVPGRLASSPWPDRIEILNTEEISQDTYEVKGEIIEITSAELENDGVAAKRPMMLTVKKINERWLIDEVTVGDYSDVGSLDYLNSEYGFRLLLPETWKD